MKKIKTKTVVKVKYYYFEFDSLIEAVDFAKTCIRKGEDIDYNDVEVGVTFRESEEQEEQEDE